MSTKIDIGINEKDRKAIAKGLSELLADSYSLYLMTHNFHWNVKGQMFNTLHTMFMAQYTEQWTALDLIAERIPVLLHGDTLNEAIVHAVQRDLIALDKTTFTFFYPNYIDGWQQALALATGELS